MNFMKVSLAFLTLFYPILIFGQVDFNNPPWNIGCDTMRFQSEMNTCSFESFKIADSILNENYNTLISYLDSISFVEKKKLTSKSEKSESDYIHNFIAQKAAVIKSKKEFYAYRRIMVEIISLEYTGGSMQPLVDNTYALEITINQLKILTNMMTEIMQ